ncbi:MAG: hypothetical protein IJI92_00015 [Erysipelotrichaceae bacterium]|nr:hypothetical protein [Erysipelotrichaceae bacterium]
MIRYYKIHDPNVLGMSEDRKYYLYINGKWEKDSNYIIFGKLNGYDPYEPEGSPYGWGSTSVMDEIEEISEEEAKRIMENI